MFSNYIDIKSILFGHFSTVSKVLISRGHAGLNYNGSNFTEVIDLEKSNVICKDLDDVPISSNHPNNIKYSGLCFVGFYTNSVVSI